MIETSVSNLKPIVKLTQVDKIEKALQEYFIQEQLQPGDSLPKELELANALCVSRTAIREALSRFKTLGIIESRKNRGMVITSPDIFNNMKRILNAQLLDNDTMKDIFTMRLVIEMGIADILFLKKTETNLRELENIVKLEEQTLDPISRLKYDVDFHSMLYKISDNTTIQRFQNLLLPIFNYVDNVIHVEKQAENANFISHRLLLNTLKNGTPEDFRSKMKLHLNNYFDKLKNIEILELV